ncbi:hypothetical protein [Nesterenkonia flava]|uniref:Uncharacterized protein n=1 Tax=Nesterenkonia flava TaxID=469799 RepID=A0ABU1FS62_9MICC|nr:hypothetical protein [Nesterenkonia flava]MDR5711003.1 hypothetical protein [Nesterenkonia flava]
MPEILALVVLVVVVVMLVRMFVQRQARRMGQNIHEKVTPENARKAALLLTDEQHRELYRTIAAEDGRRAVALFRQATGASIADSIIAVQALYRYPQQSPSEIRFEEGFNLNDDDGDQVEDESLEDAIDQVREDLQDDSGPLAEADPNTGEILGENKADIPDIPGGERPAAADDDEVDERARELLRESGFDPDQELTIPEEWAAEQAEELAGFHLEVQRGEEKITLSHEDLEPWVHDQLYALLRDDHVDEAAQLLSDHSPLTTEEAHRFLVVFKNQS